MVAKMMTPTHILVVANGLGMVFAAQPTVPTTGEILSEPFSFQTEEGVFFDGIIELPPGDRRNGYATILIGGGAASDRDWTVPAEYTTTGAATKDAAELSRRLLASGYVVMRWDAIMHDDPMRAKDPNLVTPFPYPETAKHALLAFEQFKKRKLVPDDHIFLIGHSLGARRACHILEQCKTLAGIVMLAGASLAQTDYESGDLRSLSGGLLGEMDWSGDNFATLGEFEQWKFSGTESPLASQPFAQMDRDKDGVLGRWELATQLALNDRPNLFAEGAVTRDRHGMRYAEDILHDFPTPVLAIYGTLDQLCTQGVLLRDRLAGAAYPSFDLRIVPDLGHCLAPETKGRTGPMSPVVFDMIITWLDAQRTQKSKPNNP